MRAYDRILQAELRTQQIPCRKPLLQLAPVKKRGDQNQSSFLQEKKSENCCFLPGRVVNMYFSKQNY